MRVRTVGDRGPSRASGGHGGPYRGLHSRLRALLCVRPCAFCLLLPLLRRRRRLRGLWLWRRYTPRATFDMACALPRRQRCRIVAQRVPHNRMQPLHRLDAALHGRIQGRRRRHGRVPGASPAADRFLPCRDGGMQCVEEVCRHLVLLERARPRDGEAWHGQLWLGLGKSDFKRNFKRSEVCDTPSLHTHRLRAHARHRRLK